MRSVVVQEAAKADARFHRKCFLVVPFLCSLYLKVGPNKETTSKTHYIRGFIMRYLKLLEVYHELCWAFNITANIVSLNGTFA